MEATFVAYARGIMASIAIIARGSNFLKCLNSSHLTEVTYDKQTNNNSFKHGSYCNSNSTVCSRSINSNPSSTSTESAATGAAAAAAGAGGAQSAHTTRNTSSASISSVFRITRTTPVVKVTYERCSSSRSY
jgi:hypothetical protein